MAFTTKQMALLTTAIDNMRDDRKSFEAPALNVDDIMRMSIREEDRVTMQRAAELVDNHYMDRLIRAGISTTKFKDVQVIIRLAGTKPDGSAMFLVPKYATTYDTHPLVAASPDLDAHLTSIIDINIDFNYVRKTLEHLDSVCATAAHVAFFWPSIRVLADRAMKLNEQYGSRIVDAIAVNTKKSLPPLNPAIRAACKETAEIITAAQILGRSDEKWNTGYSMSIMRTTNYTRETPLGLIHA